MLPVPSYMTSFSAGCIFPDITGWHLNGTVSLFQRHEFSKPGNNVDQDRFPLVKLIFDHSSILRR